MGKVNSHRSGNSPITSNIHHQTPAVTIGSLSFDLKPLLKQYQEGAISVGDVVYYNLGGVTLLLTPSSRTDNPNSFVPQMGVGLLSSPSQGHLVEVRAGGARNRATGNGSGGIAA